MQLIVESLQKSVQINQFSKFFSFFLKKK